MEVCGIRKKSKVIETRRKSIGAAVLSQKLINKLIRVKGGVISHGEKGEQKFVSTYFDLVALKHT